MVTSVGVIGLGVMGSALARNLARKGYNVTVYNRTHSKTDNFLRRYSHEGKFTKATSIKDVLCKLPTNKVVFLMLSAGAAVDLVSDELVLEVHKRLEGDNLAIIDGGNSFYKDTMARSEKYAEKGVEFIGLGISGGKDGALNGPSLMFGGSDRAWQWTHEILEKAAARDYHGRPCVSRLGPNGAGHFVKMVHNGIEYAIMGMIAEVFNLLRSVVGDRGLAVASDSLVEHQDLGGYLLELMRHVVRKRELGTGHPLVVDRIRDVAGHKGTGLWTCQAALELGYPVPSIQAAFEERAMSARTATRCTFSKALTISGMRNKPQAEGLMNRTYGALAIAIRQAFSQGLSLIFAASKKYSWDIDIKQCTRVWQGGCIIRMPLLREFEETEDTYGSAPDTTLTFTHQESYVKPKSGFTRTTIESTLSLPLEECEGETWWASSPRFRKIAFDKVRMLQLQDLVYNFMQAGIPCHVLSSTMNYITQMCKERMESISFIQAMRDGFGSHGFERIDQDGSYTLEWAIHAE
ncbi:6-phosphogluconate dehydrogenase, NADP(+)-dependent, decarboxylating [Aduncisulcus paluster]|uniref:6-phosphogluconate dehydrogenase, decarboxylating n=1 Tax=Aduncisulcus paluster TaxID=2918883 RepID=A0ABQ5KQC8_9EUKA|nr:6-phosphogluconate dehydrogenase, NADP(+)-dependent, decarboxylating [Aduncisulcus paluster]